MWVVITLLVLLVCVINLIFNYNSKARILRRIPGPKDTFILGNALEILVTPVELFHLGRVYANKFTNIYRFWAIGVGSVNIFNPQDVEIILSNTKYNDKSAIYKFMKPWLRDGLLLSTGPKWLQRRKVLTPAFHFSMLQNFCGTIEDNSRRLVEKLMQQERDCIDVVPILSESTLSTICETAMGTKLDDEKSNAGKLYKKAIYELGKLFIKRFIKIYLHSDFIFGLSSAGRSQQVHMKTVHSFSSRVVQERRDHLQKHGHVSLETSKANSGEDVYMSSKKKNVAMLDLLLLAEKEGSINDIGIKEEVDTFIFEGHDTSASGLSFCLMLLANNQEAQDKAATELTFIFGNSERPANLDDLANMRYLECCIKETLRLYPPVHFISRQLNESVTLSNYTVPAGVHCHIHIFDLHRREDLFKNALTFDPDRFLPENCIGRHPYAYIPFSAGSRNCIGQKFAMLEMKSVVSSILRKFSLLPVTTPDDLALQSDLVLRNSKPIYVNFVNRY